VSLDQRCSEPSQANQETSCVPSPLPARELSSLLPELNSKHDKQLSHSIKVHAQVSVTNTDMSNYSKNTHNIRAK